MSAILKDVAGHLGISRQTLLGSLFGIETEPILDDLITYALEVHRTPKRALHLCWFWEGISAILGEIQETPRGCKGSARARWMRKCGQPRAELEKRGTCCYRDWRR